MELSDYEKKAVNKFAEACHNGLWSSDGLSELLKVISDYGNVEPLNTYCKSRSLHYNTVKKKAITFGSKKFIIDNQ
jgi:hypothetical protein